MEKQEHFISLRLNNGLIEDLRKVSDRLELDRSATVRLALQHLIGKYLETESDLIVLEKDKWDSIIGKFMQRIESEPQRMEKVIKETMEKITAKLAEKLKQEGILK